MTIGEKIYNLRKQNDMTQIEFAKKCGVSQASLNFWENGKRQPKIEQLIKISKEFNIPLDNLIDTNNQFVNNNIEKNDRDITKDLDNIINKLKNSEDGPACYDGENIPEEDMEMFAAQLEIMLRRLKTINKKKYNPNKNKPPKE